MYWIGFYVFFFVEIVSQCGGWKAIPANQAMYALRTPDYGIRRQYIEVDKSDALLPRDQLNHIYKFGYCTPDATARPFLHKVVNITFPTWESTQVNYIYLLARKNTINYLMQCIVMKSYVPLKYMFYKSRLPLYYCYGEVYFLMLNTISKFQIHEFFIYSKLSMPIDMSFEFYRPTVI